MPQKTSPTQRTLAKLRKDGYTCAIVEHWNRFAGIRQDLYGFIDILALKKGETLAVQTTTSENLSKRVKKITDHEKLPVVLDAGWRVVVHDWSKSKKTDKWVCREFEF